MNNIYVMYGNNYSLIKRKIDEIKKDIIDVIEYDLLNCNIKEVLDDALCMSLFGDKKVVIGSNATFLTSDVKDNNQDISYFEKYINDENHDNILIIYVLSDKLDERKKIVKLLKEKTNFINFLPIDDKNIYNFVINEFKNLGYKINNEIAKYFISYVGKDIDIILSEINKMILYKEEEKEITKKDINDISSYFLNDNIFDFCDAIMKKDFKKIFSCYDDLTCLKVDPSKIIGVISNQFILIYQVKLLLNNNMNYKDIATRLNVHPYRVKLALETDYMLYELKDIIKKLHNLDLNMKKGNISYDTGFESFLLHL